MTLEEFLRNNRGIGENGSDLPNEILIQLYQSIVANEIRLEQREFISSVQEGWLFKQGGRVKTWKKRYTILSGNVLYYFKTPKDVSPGAPPSHMSDDCFARASCRGRGDVPLTFALLAQLALFHWRMSRW